MNLAQLIQQLQALSAEIGPDARVGVRGDANSPRLLPVWGIEEVSTGKRDPEKIVSRQGVRSVSILAIG